jgi:hypothetical protein
VSDKLAHIKLTGNGHHLYESRWKSLRPWGSPPLSVQVLDIDKGLKAIRFLNIVLFIPTDLFTDAISSSPLCKRYYNLK